MPKLKLEEVMQLIPSLDTTHKRYKQKLVIL